MHRLTRRLGRYGLVFSVELAYMLVADPRQPLLGPLVVDDADHVLFPSFSLHSPTALLAQRLYFTHQSLYVLARLDSFE